jgi:hypothetical protein
MTVRLNEAFWLVPFTVRENPPGLVAKVSTTVLGSSRTLVAAESPPETVAISRWFRKQRTVNPPIAHYNFLYPSSRPALRAAACGGRPRPATIGLVGHNVSVAHRRK